MEAVAENLCIEADVGSSTMTVLLRQLQFQYDKWILSTSTERKDQLEALNAHGNAEGAIREVRAMSSHKVYLFLWLLLHVT